MKYDVTNIVAVSTITSQPKLPNHPTTERCTYISAKATLIHFHLSVESRLPRAKSSVTPTIYSITMYITTLTLSLVHAFVRGISSALSSQSRPHTSESHLSINPPTSLFSHLWPLSQPPSSDNASPLDLIIPCNARDKEKSNIFYRTLYTVPTML